MGVQLRVPRPGGPVLEPGHDPPGGAHPDGPLSVALVPAQPVPRVGFEVGQRLADRRPVRRADRGRHLG